MAPRKKKVEVQEGEFKEIEAVQEAPVEAPAEEQEIGIEKGILLGVTEDGRLFHKYVGTKDMQIHEAEGLREYLGRVLDSRWNEILGDRK